MRESVARIAAFTAVALVVYGLVMAVVAAFTPPDPFSQAGYAPLGVGLGGAAAYYFVYMDGYERLRNRLG